MKKIVSLLMLLVGCVVQLTAAVDHPDPQADPDAIVTSGRARFTVLTPEMIRIQYSTTSKFEDRATFAVINRRLTVPKYTTREEGDYLYIETDKLCLRYKKGSTINPNMKSPNNLSISMKVNDVNVTWYPGKEDALNLKGTRRTLDGGSGDNYRNDLEDGIISRGGWAIIDESPRTTRGDGSTTFAFDKQVDGIDWVAKPVDVNAYDWYFMGYGHNYKKAIGDYIKIAGRQPLPPLYALGYWYSKYQRYTQTDFVNLVNEIQKNKIPIDVMIMDMDWHLDGWTGWTWNKNIIPNPTGLIRWMHEQGLKVSLNLHPADGVASYEEHFSEMRDDMGLSSNVDRIPWELEDSTFYRAMFDRIIRDREKQGVDFWWLDWQQNLTSDATPGLSETFWCNHVFFNDMRLNRKDRRPMIFHRWGGMGSHRYPIGFSGDTYGTYGSLTFQPYFTATASNVCFGYWGHDIGGHLQIGETNPELMLRWLQFGVFSPIFRTHGASQAGNERRIWKYDNFPLLLDCVNLRYELMPYIYTAARQAYDTGISICRPLYYEWPEENESYRQEGEYMFGDDILVSPVTTASEDADKTFRSTWLPKGRWYDVCRHRLIEGEQTISDYYAMNEIPYFIKAGAVIPCNPHMDNLKSQADELVLKIIPGADGSTVLYEDEGDTQGYMEGAYTNTTITQTMGTDRRIVSIRPREGAFKGMVEMRSYTVMFMGETKPDCVKVDGQTVDTWTYDETTGIVTVGIEKRSCNTSATIEIQHWTENIQDTTTRNMKSERFFDMQGRELARPVIGHPYIVRRTWSDGIVTTQKAIQ
ncbi:glycoside hydrolase family 31 protein [Prevotella sp. E13-17]|uniref:glycoside hydrolase family 31 protein n=1 Tax=Prevotella sp. E13-17 TaxID=2913616 RepID=UPI001EDBA3EA|nr:glycoside hydrolase family 31 protein [Prevotella sp. E13-17]UKK51160.1 glycoside hydrolase family 31 protein [Prevotella sp. E13-17]